MSNFWHSFTDGLLFGMLGRNPMFGCFSHFMPSFNFFSPFPIIPPMPVMSFPRINSVFDFSQQSSSTETFTPYPIMPDLYISSFNQNYMQYNNPAFQNNFNFTTMCNNSNTDQYTNRNSSNAESAATKKTNNSANNTPVTKKTNTQKSSKSNSLRKSNSSNVKHWTKMTDAEMRSIYGNYDRDVTKPFTGTAADLNKFLNTKASGMLKNKGSVFMAAQKKYGISALVLAGICGQESTYGKKGSNSKFYNIANMRNVKGNFKRFNNVDECIMDLARMLRESYVDKTPENPNAHLRTLYQINARFCPVGVDNNTSGWAAGVEACISSIQRNIA